MKNTRFLGFTAVLAAALTATCSIAPASASEPATDPTVSLSAPITVASDFDASEGGLIVGGQDGAKSFGASPSKTSRLNSCEIWRNFTAVPGGNVNSVQGCSLIGTTNNVIVTYTWERTAGSGKATIQGKGFNALRAPVWQNAPGDGTKGQTSILWGNVAANKQIRGFSSKSFAGINWR
jgi:hypothetical protein